MCSALCPNSVVCLDLMTIVRDTPSQLSAMGTGADVSVDVRTSRHRRPGEELARDDRRCNTPVLLRRQGRRSIDITMPMGLRDHLGLTPAFRAAHAASGTHRGRAIVAVRTVRTRLEQDVGDGPACTHPCSCVRGRPLRANGGEGIGRERRIQPPECADVFHRPVASPIRPNEDGRSSPSDSR